jgi:hypothetical protein
MAGPPRCAVCVDAEFESIATLVWRVIANRRCLAVKLGVNVSATADHERIDRVDDVASRICRDSCGGNRIAVAPARLIASKYTAGKNGRFNVPDAGLRGLPIGG